MSMPDFSAKRLLTSLLCMAMLGAGWNSVAQDRPAPGLGQAISEAQLDDFDLVAPPGGSGFPEGSGTAAQGRSLFNQRCAACHGSEGQGTSGNTVLVGGSMQSEGTPLRTVGSYWPHASTLFDYIRRAMPADAPKSLDNSEVYQLTAYLLYLNGIIGEQETLDRAALLSVTMPNADGFIDRSQLH
ncbi:MAG: cytochrome c [Pseudomonadales bacterium]|nr:cytochrome c [Pseudomonadales bacterium]